ncbi:MAG: hypothetical protein UE295_02875 [Acutalibacteraceae bacterium]|nr:hypothetical protein [Acutalibacteraceae bacterium]
MVLENDNCIIEIKVDETFTVDSTDNRHYDIIHNPCGYKHNDYSKTLAIYVNLFSKEYSIALVGSHYSYDYDCAILEDDTIIVLQNDTITVINIFDGSIIKYIEIDCFSCNFAIYKVKDGYIIYGELEIIMLDFNFVKKWSFSGRDIFVSISGKNAFELKSDSICLYDFLDNYYEIDYNGNLIN